MAKFKAGDRVRVAFPVEGWAYRPESFLGASGAVVSWEDDAGDHSMGGDLRLNNGQTWSFYASELEPEIVSDTPTLRDQFAMAALTGLLATGGRVDDETIRAAYLAANLMPAERESAK